jgi:predicted transcriptional regulator
MPTIKQRVTINLSDGEYGELAALAEQHNLSMAWIGHKAIVDFLENNRSESLQLPLTFAKPSDRSRLPTQD